MSEVQNTTTEQAEEQKAPNITVDDIVLTQRVIALASSRGAFKANELSAVGGLYDRIAAFVQYHAKPAEGSEGSEEGPTEGSEGEVNE